MEIKDKSDKVGLQVAIFLFIFLTILSLITNWKNIDSSLVSLLVNFGPAILLSVVFYIFFRFFKKRMYTES